MDDITLTTLAAARRAWLDARAPDTRERSTLPVPPRHYVVFAQPNLHLGLT
jgi:hypothetical protein